MKSTTRAAISSEGLTPPAFARTDKWKALPFMLLMLTTNLPLNYKLEPARPLGVADVAELSAAATTGAGGPSSILYALFMACMYGVAAWMLLTKPKATAAVLQRQWPLVLLLFLIFASTLWSEFPDKVMNNVIHNSGMLFIGLAAALRYRHDPWLFPKHLSYVLGINLIFHLIAIAAMPTYTIDWEGRWHGMATHPNSFGVMAFVVLWANTAVLLYKKSETRSIHLLFAALAVVALVGANSVTSIMVSMVSVFLIYTIKKLNALGVGLRFYSSVLAIVFFLAMVIVMVGVAFDLSGLFELFGRDANLTGRTSIWEDAVKAIVDRPLIGWSFDDHAYLIKQGFAYQSYHNGYLDLAVCGGVVAMVLLVLMLVAWALEFAKSSRVGQIIAPYSASFTIAYLLHNISEASLVAPRSQMWEIFLVLVFLGACKKWSDRDNVRAPNVHQSLSSGALG